MLKEFLLKKTLQSKLGDVPPEQREKILKAFEKDPTLFMRIAEEIKIKMNGGGDQMNAAMEVLKSHKDEIGKLIQ